VPRHPAGVRTEKLMPFDNIVAEYTRFRNEQTPIFKPNPLAKELLTKMESASGAFTLTSNRLDQAAALVPKLITAYKAVIAEAKDLEQKLQTLINLDDDPVRPNVAKDLLKEVGVFRGKFEKKVKSLESDKRKYPDAQSTFD
jgi:hypothetical protein